MSAPLHDAAGYAGQLSQLLPRGAAWRFAPGGIFSKLLLGLADEPARVEGRALDLVEEADPRTALELLPDWERAAGLPDPCTGDPGGISERRAALVRKLTTTQSQSRASYIAMAAAIGFVITIEEYKPMRAGFRAGDRCNDLDWAFTWTVHVHPFPSAGAGGYTDTVMRAGFRAGDRLRTFGAVSIECLIRRAAPAHTTVNFAYDLT